MRIVSFWARGYRSLRNVRIDDLGAFNVFYGGNGTGKSNILAAMRLFFYILQRGAGGCGQEFGDKEHACGEWGRAVANRVQRVDYCERDESKVVVLGARFLRTSADSPLLWPVERPDLTIEVTFDGGSVRLSRLESGDSDLRDAGPLGWPELRKLVVEALARRAYHLIGTERHLVPENSKLTNRSGPYDPVVDLSAGLKNALFNAGNAPSVALRRRVSAFRSLLTGPPLNRPPFAVVRDPMTNAVEINERLPDPNPEGLELPIDFAGLGISQIYLILSEAMLSDARAVGIEEPEAHLHAPTSGRHLRQLLKRLVEENHVDQLFIATHSNLFDLDSTGYFNVSLSPVDGCTVVERAELTRIDREHLYEPGPAKHALQRMLEYMPPAEVVFRHGNGSPITAADMLQLLEEGDDVAVAFLEDLHGAALRMVKVGAKKKAG
jgi:hypothetical protein